MMKTKLSRALGLASIGASLAFVPAHSTFAEDDLEEVIVTGSFIRGTPEDAALPVDVLSREDLEEVGNPTLIEMVRNLGVTSGNIGETNQFDTRGGQGNEGVSTVNLRGLGSARTLVLLNGRRHVSTDVNGVDISALPSTAIGRVEVLKDGAAALYGSDAIAGVVNFITRENFEGLEIRGSHQNIQDSDGDNNIALIFGKQMDDWHFAFSAEYEERGQLQIRDRDWALPTFAENPAAGISSIGNPGTLFATFGNSQIFSEASFNALQAGAINGTQFLFGAARPDANCEALGAQLAAPFCRFQFTFFDNLIEETETQKFFAEANWDITDNLRFHAEALYSEVDIPEWDTSPSYPPQALLGPDRVLQANHPGLVDYKAQNPGFFQDITVPGGTVIPAAAQGAIVWSRMLGVAGRNGEPESAQRLTETKRIAFGLDGETDNGIGFDLSMSWSERVRTLGGSDMFIERMAFALDGLGGPNCDRDAAFANGTAGQNGCEFYNPLSNAIQRSAVNGAVNPQFNPAVANSDELINWLTADTGSKTINDLFVFDAVFNAQTDIQLGGGNVGWAAGFQVRLDDYEFTVKDVANRAINPCPFNDPLSIALGHVTAAEFDCGANGAGQLAFLAATDEEFTSREVYGFFGEVALPLTDTLDVQLAARYEDYGDSGGDTFDPKIAVSWSPTDELTIRGSASSTFRGPPASFLGGVGTSLDIVGTAFKAIDTAGNPDLKPESAIAVNVGAIYQNANIYASLDYWSFDFEDPFQNEAHLQILGAYNAAACFDGGAGVGSATCDVLRTRITPTGSTSQTLQRIRRNVINGSDIQTSGLDYVINYTFDQDVFGGVVTIGSEGTYTLEFDSDDFVSLEGIALAPGGDFVGDLNDGTPFTPKPELKANFYAKWGNDEHRVTYNALFVDEYDDVSATVASFQTIDDHLTHDIHYINNMFEDWTLSLSIVNISDEDPPEVFEELAYDGYTHNPFGRMIKLGVVFTPQL